MEFSKIIFALKWWLLAARNILDQFLRFQNDFLKSYFVARTWPSKLINVWSQMFFVSSQFLIQFLTFYVYTDLCSLNFDSKYMEWDTKFFLY